MSVTRLKGATSFGTYVVSVTDMHGKIYSINVNGKPHPSVTDICNTLANSHTKLIDESIKAIKLTMAKHNEYRGYTNE